MISSFKIHCDSCVMNVNGEKKYYYDERFSGETNENQQKSGEGEANWTCAEFMNSYGGLWLRDFMHGVGEYKWRFQGTSPILHATYEGTFFANHMDGHGRMSYANGTNYKGFFMLNCRFGPGIETSPNMKSNVGFWCGNQLVRLAWFPPVLVIPDFDADSETHDYAEYFRTKLMTVNKLTAINMASNQQTVSQLKLGISSEDELLIEGSKTILSSKSQTSTCEKTQRRPQFDNNNPLYDEELFGFTMFNDTWEELQNIKGSTKLCNLGHPTININLPEGSQLFNAWNSSIDILFMMKQAYRYREYMGNFNLSAIVSGERESFKPPDEYELDCRAFLLATYLGDIVTVMKLVNHHNVSPNLMDAKGNTGLMYACMGGHADIVSFLLIAGAEPNKKNDDCITALNLALMRYLSIQNGDVPVEFLPTSFVPLRIVRILDRTSMAVEWNFVRSDTTPDKKKQLKEKNSKTKLASRSKRSMQRATSNTHLGDKESYNSLYEELLAKLHSTKRQQFDFPPQIYRVEDVLISLEISKLTNGGGDKNAPKFNTMKSDSFAEDIESKRAGLETTKKAIFDLLNGGADPKESHFPLPPLAMAILSKQKDIVECFLERGDYVNAQYFQLSNLTPIIIAITDPFNKETLDMVRCLLEAGASPNQRLHSSFPDCKSMELTRSYMSVLGTTLLHIAVLLRPNGSFEEQMQKDLIKVLLDNDANPNEPYLAHMALELAMKKDLGLLETFISHPLVDANMEINSAGETVLGTFFKYSFFTSNIEVKVLEGIRMVLKYGADPLLKPSNYVEEYHNIFAYANSEFFKATKRELGFKAVAVSEPEIVNGGGKKTKANGGSRMSFIPTRAVADIGYERAYQIVLNFGRELFARRVRYQVIKKIVKLINKYKHKNWYAVVPHITFRKAILAWLSAQHLMNDWDMLPELGHAKSEFENQRRFFVVLVIVCYFTRVGLLREKINHDTIVLVEADAGDYMKRNEQNKHDFGKPTHKQCAEPENPDKYNICFECLLPLVETILKCRHCEEVSFCSEECLNTSYARAREHLCEKLYAKNTGTLVT